MHLATISVPSRIFGAFTNYTGNNFMAETAIECSKQRLSAGKYSTDGPTYVKKKCISAQLHFDREWTCKKSEVNKNVDYLKLLNSVWVWKTKMELYKRWDTALPVYLELRWNWAGGPGPRQWEFLETSHLWECRAAKKITYNLIWLCLITKRS